ncbi:MAG: hypothetical protein H7338_08285 [Candidatus Sericytochromatia bacterium]|nr:hypothetical protein [Candidatus Sericytochromatia bacterium]
MALIRRTLPVLLCAVVVMAPNAGAVDTKAFAGTFSYAGDAAERKANDADVDRITAPFDAGLRTRMRAKMHGSPWLPKRVKIVIRDNAVGIQKDDQPIRMSRLDGTPATFTEKGMATTVTHMLTANTLSEISRVDGLVRTLRFRLSDDDRTLTVQGAVETQPFKGPLRYSATFRRVTGE